MFFNKKFQQISDNISYVYDAYSEVSFKCLQLKQEHDKLLSDHADTVLAYHELEKRVIALEHFKDDVGTEILETVQEQKKQEQKISEGMDNIFSYTSQGKKDK